MNGIVWLASYPKSGNTWFRAFISSLLNEADEDISINRMKTDGIFSSRALLDALAGIEVSNLTPDEADIIRPKAYNHLAQSSEKQLFIKVHDAYTYLPDGSPLLGTESAKAVYILRNPLDVTVSYANHMSVDIDTAITKMSQPEHTLCKNVFGLQSQLRQKLLTWSGHVESWAGAKELPVHFIRYEDMKHNPLEAFTAAVRFIGLEHSQEQIANAIEQSSFDKLKAEEDSKGFKERPVHTASFFRAGNTGDWRSHLTDELRDRVIDSHKAVMLQYGYLDNDGNPVY